MGSRLEANSDAVRKRIESHTFNDEEGEEYGGSKFGGFPEYFRRKKIKLQNLDAQLRAESTGKPQIFKGIVAHVNGYTQPSLNDLHELIVSYGGGFMQYLDGKTTVTHIIASNLTPKKAVEFKAYRIVKPAWIVDSVKAGAVQPWDRYRVVDEGVGQKVLQFQNGSLSSQVNKKAKGYRDQTDDSWYTRQFAAINGLDEIPPHQHEDVQARVAPPKPQESSSRNAFKVSPGSQTESRYAHGKSISPNGHTLLISDAVESNDDRKEETSFSYPGVADEDLLHADRNERPTSGVAAGVSPNQLQLEDQEVKSPVKRKQDLDARSPSPKRAKLTAEEHNSVLLSDPRIRKSSVLNPEFLEQYYRESRLHHLSTWKAELKSKLQALTAEKSASQKAQQKRAPGARRYILHVDFDSFFVAVSLKSHPEWQDKPCVVAHGSGPNSEVASCNYPARAYGIKNGAWMKYALDKYKDLKVLPYDFPGYEEASRLFYEAIMDSGGIVQSVSVDEALVDVTALCLPAGGTDGTSVREGSIWREQEKADQIAQGIRSRVKAQTGCAVSIGIGGNILLAKVALRKAKPAGQHHIKPEEALGFIGELEVQSLPGVAYSIGAKLEEIGVKFVKGIRELSKERLISHLGPKTGEKIWNYSRAIDKTEVGDQVIRKSVSAEVNWGVRFETNEQVDEFIESLCGELNRRLLKEGVRGQQLTMKVMRRAPDAPLDPPKHLGHGKCDTYNKSIALGVATNAKEILTKEALTILRGWGFSPGELRGLGVQMTKLEPLRAMGNIESSQRRLQFKDTVPAPKLPPKPAPKPASQAVPDPIDDPETPKKPKSSKFNLPTLLDNPSTPSRKPLNTHGTQFILPTQVDPTVLAQLPQDIRSRLAKHVESAVPPPHPKSDHVDKDAPHAPFAFTALPSHSQLDTEILQALPADLRAEVLAEYEVQNHSYSPNRRRGGQAVLPQSPRKNRTVNISSKRGVTRGRPRGGSLLARLKGVSRDTHTLTQSNFVNVANDAHSRSDSGTDVAEISSEFLDALPEDIRRELLEHRKREQLKHAGGIEVSHRRKRAAAQDQSARGRPVGLVVPRQKRAPRPTFTAQKLWRPEGLREAIKAWFEEFRDEGPYDEDVDALGKYLTSVIKDEHHMDKAINVVRWLAWVVDESLNEVAEDETIDRSQVLGDEARKKWQSAVSSAKDTARKAAKSRGLGEVDFGI
ncbi:MAG: deoxycytidyl transferase [Chrysothrix sp. TS-e1954]|nr:MAG: deoxycytidyl transferase [Chrysothrix sp. TS-e1954]